MHHGLHHLNVLLEIKSEKSRQDDGAQKVGDCTQRHHQQHGFIRIPLCMQAAPVNHTDKGLRGRVEGRCEDTAENGNQHGAYKDRQTVFPAVPRRKSHHRNRKQKEKGLFQHSARLSVEKEQYAENSYKQCPECQFLCVFIHI